MNNSEAEHNIKQLLFWNRFWLALLGTLLLLGMSFVMWRNAIESWEAVDSDRHGDEICFHSGRGGVAITHVGAEGLVAALPRPAFIVDSGKGCVSVSTFKNLDWRSDNGDRYPAPPPASDFVGLYVRLERTKKRTSP